MCERHDHNSSSQSRAGFLRTAGATLFAAALVGVPKVAPARSLGERILWLHNSRTGESLTAPFTLDGKTIYYGGGPDNPGYLDICRILRDTHVPLAEGDVLFDIRTIEALYEVQQILGMVGVNQPIDIYSGYRTQKTNASVEGAKFSYHMRAQAVDFGVEGVSMDYLWKVCNSRPITGGLGYYSDHLHLDCGPRRYWNG